MKRKLLFAIILSGSVALFAMDPVALTNAALFVKTRGLESEHACADVMSFAARRNGWAEQDCTDVLLLAYELCRSATNAFEKGCRQHAVSLLGQFGGTNAIPNLLSIMQNEEDSVKFCAGKEYLHGVRASPQMMGPMKEEMARATREGGPFAREIYTQIDFDLTYDAPSPLFQRNLLRFLLDQTVVERAECAQLDEILCREVPKWRASPQRAENAARMIHEHPDNARLVAFFETIRTNALESARAESRASPDASTTRAVPTDAESDPWADLLSDLPEKKPWTPPTDGVLSN